MALPHINISLNSSSEIQLFWEALDTSNIESFNVYWSGDNIAFSLLSGGIRNQPNYYGKYVFYQFNRSDIGKTETDQFFLRLTTIDSFSVESSPGGSIKVNAAIDPVPDTIQSTQHVIVHNYGFDPNDNIWRRLKVNKAPDADDETGTLVFSGVSGIIGITGPQGQTGVYGETGVQGETGLQGYTGVQGATGIRGPSGESAEPVFHIASDTSITEPGVYFVDSSGGDVDITLPDSSAGLVGDRYRFYKESTDGNEVSIQTTSGQEIAGKTIQYIREPFKGFTAIDDYEVGDEKYQIVQDSRKSNIEGLTGIGATGRIDGDILIFDSSLGQWVNRDPVLIGVTGVQGETGVQGIQGETGALGNTGVQGETGTLGNTGTQGETGVQGTQGVTGTAGIEGVTRLSSNTVLDSSYNYLVVDTESSDVELTLPTISSVGPKSYKIKNIANSGNYVRVYLTGSDLIEGSETGFQWNSFLNAYEFKAEPTGIWWVF